MYFHTNFKQRLTNEKKVIQSLTVFESSILSGNNWIVQQNKNSLVNSFLLIIYVLIQYMERLYSQRFQIQQ